MQMYKDPFSWTISVFYFIFYATLLNRFLFCFSHIHVYKLHSYIIITDKSCFSVYCKHWWKIYLNAYAVARAKTFLFVIPVSGDVGHRRFRSPGNWIKYSQFLSSKLLLSLSCLVKLFFPQLLFFKSIYLCNILQCLH
jgi:hypothetical protein